MHLISTVDPRPRHSEDLMVIKEVMVDTLVEVMATIKAMVVETMVTVTMTVTIKGMAVTIIDMVDRLIVVEGAASVSSMVGMILVNMSQEEDFNTGTVIARQSNWLCTYKHHLLGIWNPIHARCCLECPALRSSTVGAMIL